jgi:RNA polymerase sigma-70 factor (ECF subfamily)
MLDALAFDAAYRAWNKRLRAVSYRVTGESADAEDIAQEAWIEAWKAREQIDGAGFWRWLCRVVKRVWWHRINRVKGRNKAPDMLPIEEAPEGIIDMPQHHEAQQIQVLEAIDTLRVPTPRGTAGKPASESMKQTAILTLGGWSAVEIADHRRVSAAAVKDTLAKAILALRKKWRLE